MPTSHSNAHLSRTDLSPESKAGQLNRGLAQVTLLHSAKDDTAVELQKNIFKSEHLPSL